jgi:hypothetical protein
MPNASTSGYLQAILAADLNASLSQSESVLSLSPSSLVAEWAPGAPEEGGDGSRMTARDIARRATDVRSSRTIGRIFLGLSSAPKARSTQGTGCVVPERFARQPKGACPDETRLVSDARPRHSLTDHRPPEVTPHTCTPVPRYRQSYWTAPKTHLADASGSSSNSRKPNRKLALENAGGSA